MSDIEKMPLVSMDVAAERIEKLKAIFPEAFVEGKVDHDALLRSLGQWVEPGKERFGLNWPGKVDCMKVIQTPSVGTLLPMKEESVNFDTTENLIIEGDNLEALKLLQKSYFGKVKMIYIDPPYNTGGEFIYPDNYREGLQEYLRYSGQVDADGYKLSTNTEAEGRFHSRWLSMMYPRLFVARNLLRDDGVIFVSIDDNEGNNLRALMNEVFGEENFISCFTIVNNMKGRSDDKFVAKAHEYLLCYQRGNFQTYGIELPESYLEEYDKIETDGRRYRLLGLRKRGSNSRRQDRPNMYYPFYYDTDSKSLSLDKSSDSQVEILPKLSDGEDGCWRWGNSTARERIDELEVKKVTSRDEYDVFQKDYLTDSDGNQRRPKPKSVWLGSEFSSDSGTLAYKELGLGKSFTNPKPVDLVKQCITQSTIENDIILDFFAGSGTSAHAVMELNKEDGGNRKFILVQLPEKTEITEYPTIAHITRERVRRVINMLNEEDKGKLDLDGTAKQDRGFRSLKLSSSNFKVWEGDVEKVADINATLSLFAENTVSGRSQEDILYELLLKAGFALTAPVEKLALAGKDVYAVAEGALLICLDKELNLEVIEAMVEREPSQILCLDEGFKGNDQLKVNAVQTVKSRNRNEESDIVFRVV